MGEVGGWEGPWVVVLLLLGGLEGAGAGAWGG